MNKINMTKKFMLPWLQMCRIYPIKAHSIIQYILFSLQFYFFHHFDCQVLNDNLERKKKRYHLRKNCVAMETKLFPLLK